MSISVLTASKPGDVFVGYTDGRFATYSLPDYKIVQSNLTQTHVCIVAIELLQTKCGREVILCLDSKRYLHIFNLSSHQLTASHTQFSMLVKIGSSTILLANRNRDLAVRSLIVKENGQLSFRSFQPTKTHPHNITTIHAGKLCGYDNGCLGRVEKAKLLLIPSSNTSAVLAISVSKACHAYATRHLDGTVLIRDEKFRELRVIPPNGSVPISLAYHKETLYIGTEDKRIVLLRENQYVDGSEYTQGKFLPCVLLSHNKGVVAIDGPTAIEHTTSGWKTHEQKGCVINQSVTPDGNTIVLAIHQNHITSFTRRTPSPPLEDRVTALEVNQTSTGRTLVTIKNKLGVFFKEFREVNKDIDTLFKSVDLQEEYIQNLTAEVKKAVQDIDNRLDSLKLNRKDYTLLNTCKTYKASLKGDRYRLYEEMYSYAYAVFYASLTISSRKIFINGDSNHSIKSAISSFFSKAIPLIKLGKTALNHRERQRQYKAALNIRNFVTNEGVVDIEVHAHNIATVISKRTEKTPIGNWSKIETHLRRFVDIHNGIVPIEKAAVEFVDAYFDEYITSPLSDIHNLPDDYYQAYVTESLVASLLKKVKLQIF